MEFSLRRLPKNLTANSHGRRQKEFAGTEASGKSQTAQLQHWLVDDDGVSYSPIDSAEKVLVRQKTANLLSIQNFYSRNTGQSISANRIKQLRCEKVDALFPNADLALAVKANLTVMRSLETEIAILERVVKDRIKLKPAYRYLLTVNGIGQILALTIMLETGDIKRFPKVGNFASYCRCVGSEKLSNGKRKGSGNTKNGNKHLSWAFVEAANFAIRFNSRIKVLYQKKKSKSHAIVAIKAVAHKLCRACYYIIKDQVAFDVNRAFA